MAGFSGTRFAFDATNNVQYALVFKDNDVVAIKPFGDAAAVRKALTAGPITAYDDETAEMEQDGNEISIRPTYEISLKHMSGRISPNANGEYAVNTVEYSSVDASLDLPPQHTSKQADVARKSEAQAAKTQQKTPAAKSLSDIVSDAVSGNMPATQPDTNTPPKKRRPRAGEAPQRRHKIPDGALEQALLAHGIDLTERAKNGELDPTIGRDQERKDVRQFLLRKGRSSVMLLGEAGVGKTEIAKAIAQDIANGDAEAELANARLISLNLQSMNAGTQFRGAFEKKLMPILEGLEERGGYLRGQKVILFIDEIHNALTAGAASGAKGAGEIMKPYLAEGTISCIGATTRDEYKKHIESDKAMVRRFQPYTIEEPNKDDTMFIVKAVMEGLTDYHWLEETASEKMVEYVVRMTNRFMPNFQQPDKAISVLDDAMAIARSEDATALSEEHVIHAISKASGLKKEFLNQSDLEKYASLEDELNKRVLGQGSALKEMAGDLGASRMGLTNDDAPRGVFLFTGPTGVGKTETAKALAELLMGDKESLIRLDMGEYQDKHTVSRLIGSPPGYVGYDDNAGQLTEPVRNKPFSIVLLDEVEKAHPDIWKTFLPIFDDGETKDAKGRKVDFRNTIFVMTSNLGADRLSNLLSGDSAGFDTTTEIEEQGTGVENDADLKNKIERVTTQAVKDHFAPEFVNRLDGIYPFHHLEKKIFGRLVEMRLERLEKSLRESPNGLQLDNINLEVTQKVKDVLHEKGYNRQYGARPLEGALRKQMTNKLSVWMQKNKDDLLKKNSEGPFKIQIKDLGDNFNAKIVPIKAKKKKAAPAAKKADKPAA